MLIKRIVCLANSRKISGRCIAGRELANGQLGAWIRPVSNREHEEVSADERRYQDGTEPQVLDIIDVPLIGPRPQPHQLENWLLDHNFYWTKINRLSNINLSSFIEANGPLWVNGHHTFHGRNNKIPVDQLEGSGRSLRLIYVPGLQLLVHVPSASFGDHKRRIEANFHFNGDDYTLRVTDSSIEDRYLAMLDGSYNLGSSYLTVSLGEPSRGDYYKLVAAVIGADQ